LGGVSAFQAFLSVLIENARFLSKYRFFKKHKFGFIKFSKNAVLLLKQFFKTSCFSSTVVF